MKRYFCTYFDRNYLIKGVALIESLNKFEKNEFQLFVVCLDELTRVILNKLNLPNVTTIPMHEIEQGDFALIATKADRSIAEYYWTATSTVMLRIFERYPEVDALTYIDADLLFYSSPDPIFEELGDHTVLIHEHRFSPRVKFFERWGKYNVGLICFRNNNIGIEILNWWRERCLEWCYERLEDGKYGDQMYLNDWTTRFKGVGVLQNIGAGVGPWNHGQYTYSLDGSNSVLINGKPLIFYHFHTFFFENPDIIIPVADQRYPVTMDIISLCFLPYVKALFRGIATVQSVIPDFTFGLFKENTLDFSHTFLAKRNLASVPKDIQVPRFPIQLDEDWDCYCSHQLEEYPSIASKFSVSSDTPGVEARVDSHDKVDSLPTICPHCRATVYVSQKGHWACPCCNNDFLY